MQTLASRLLNILNLIENLSEHVRNIIDSLNKEKFIIIIITKI